MAAIALGTVSFLSVGAFSFTSEAGAQDRTACPTQVVANTFVAFRIEVVHPATCDSASVHIRSFLERGFISGWRCQEKFVIPHQVDCWEDGTSAEIHFVYKPHLRRGAGRSAAQGVTPLGGRYVGHGERGREVSFWFDRATMQMRNFRVNHALYSNTYFAETPVKNGEFSWDFRSAEFEMIISGRWVSEGTVEGRIWQVGLPTEHFKVSLDVPNP